ncbi:hypothetical protein FN846DRAFT_893703 [Sphaerosporella brunnea]|uniref:Uncharacterized protein n=1 Tax=Sphaerosporella brunnea TaxID=1250544 RepID=A0A5J5ELE6_9PEZI|nr:hypothetical protein FN846DRAFT_893703 [Sphaerosporella brunnea]
MPRSRDIFSFQHTPMSDPSSPPMWRFSQSGTLLPACTLHIAFTLSKRSPSTAAVLIPLPSLNIYPTASLLELAKLPSHVVSRAYLSNPDTLERVYIASLGPIPYQPRIFSVDWTEFTLHRREALMEALIHRLPEHLDMLSTILSTIIPVRGSLTTRQQAICGAESVSFGALGGFKSFLQDIQYWLKRCPEFESLGIDISKLLDLVKSMVQTELKVSILNDATFRDIWQFYQLWYDAIELGRDIVEIAQGAELLRADNQQIRAADLVDAEAGEKEELGAMTVLKVGIWEFRGPDYQYPELLNENVQDKLMFQKNSVEETRIGVVLRIHRY